MMICGWLLIFAMATTAVQSYSTGTFSVCYPSDTTNSKEALIAKLKGPKGLPGDPGAACNCDASKLSTVETKLSELSGECWIVLHDCFYSITHYYFSWLVSNVIKPFHRPVAFINIE